LLENEAVSIATEGAYSVQVHNQAVQSAMKIAGIFPELYDTIFEEFPSAYNKAGGSFGKISAVRIYDAEKAAEKNPKYLRAKPTTPFFQREVIYTCPDGFIVPLLYGLRALLEVDKDGLLVWKTNPQAFLSKYLVEVMKSYRLVIEMALWDPQKVGKNISAYEFAESAVSAVYSVRYNKPVAA
jgi:hypothetical protein